MADLLALALELTTAIVYLTRAESGFDAFPVMPGDDRENLLLQLFGFGGTVGIARVAAAWRVVEVVQRAGVQVDAGVTQWTRKSAPRKATPTEPRSEGVTIVPREDACRRVIRRANGLACQSAWMG